MAFDLTIINDNSFTLEVEGTTDTSGAISDIGANFTMKHIILSGVVTDGHKVRLLNGAKELIWEAEYQLTTSHGHFGVRDWNVNIPVHDGLYCDDMDSGRLLIYKDNVGIKRGR